MIKCFQPPNLVYNQPSPFWYQSPTVSSKSPQCLLFLLACEVKCHVVIPHKKAGNGQRDPKDLLWPSHALLVATNLLWELHWRQWHQKYKVCWHPPHWERDQNVYLSLIQTFLSRQQPHLCDLHRQQAQGGWSQIYLLGSSPSWSFPTPCSQNWAAPWRILCDPACQRGGNFIQLLVLSCILFVSFGSVGNPLNNN